MALELHSELIVCWTGQVTAGWTISDLSKNLHRDNYGIPYHTQHELGW